MRLVEDVDDVLRAKAGQAMACLRAQAFEQLYGAFGYALALGREPVAALRDDAGPAIAELHRRDPDWRERAVETLIARHGDAATGILATVECCLASGPANGFSLLQLVVTDSEDGTWLTLEGVGDGR